MVPSLGVVEVKDLDNRSRIDAPTAILTITQPKHASRGDLFKVETAIHALTTSQAEMRALVEPTRKRASIVGSQAISDGFQLASNERMKHKT